MPDQSTSSKVTIGLSSCGVAAGAAQVYEAFRREFDARGLSTPLRRTGCIGMCYREPLVDTAWPRVDQSASVRKTREMVVQVNGKLRGKISVAVDAGRDTIETIALGDPNVQRFIEGKTIRKMIVVPEKLVNIVV